MKLINLLIVSVTMALSSLAFADGVGGTSGGHILFQRNSTYVSALHNRTLCVNNGHYFATVNSCVSFGGGDNDHCEQMAKMQITQPIKSVTKKCTLYYGGDNCIKWETVPFVQEPVLKVKIKPETGGMPKTKILQIPNCK